jgi:hypothetical protein
MTTNSKLSTQIDDDKQTARVSIDGTLTTAEIETLIADPCLPPSPLSTTSSRTSSYRLASRRARLTVNLGFSLATAKDRDDVLSPWGVQSMAMGSRPVLG